MTPMLLHPTLAALSLLLIFTSAAAEPKVWGLEFTKVKKAVDPAMSGLQRRAGTVTEELYNSQLLYIANILIGSPAQNLSVQLDTGSSDLWVPAYSADFCLREGCNVWGAFDYEASGTFQSQDETGSFVIAYGDNSEYRGFYFQDTLSVGSASLDDANMALVVEAEGVVGAGPESNNGVMGIGFDLGESAAELFNVKPYTGIVSQLKRSGKINTRSYSLWLNDADATSGSILFGGVDTSKYTPPLLGLPIVGSNSSNYDKIDRLTVEFTSLSLSDQKGTNKLGSGDFVLPALLDSGTTTTMLQEDLAQAVWDEVGAVVDPELSDSLPLVSCDLGKVSASFAFAFGGDNGPKINISISQLTTELQGITFKDGTDACKFGIEKSPDGSVILGDTFLRSAYVVYDLDNNQVAMANTNLNGGAPNIKEIISDIPGVSTTLASMTLPATLSQATEAVSTELGGLAPTAEVTPTLAANGRLTAVPGKASITASPASNAEPQREFAIFGIPSLLSVLASSSFILNL